MNLMNFAFWTVSLYFFGNVHDFNQLCIKETYTFLYFMTFKAKNNSFQRIDNVILIEIVTKNPQFQKQHTN